MVSNNPIPPSAPFNFLTKTFYDNYDWTVNVPVEYRSFESGYNNNFHSPSSNWPYPQVLTSSNAIRGMVTGTINKVLNSSDELVSSQFYDEKGRVIQAISKNLLGGCEIFTTQYTFNGQVLKTMLRHQKPGSIYVTSYVFTDYDYDDLGRLIKLRKNVSATVGAANTGTTEFVLLENEYDKLGQLKNKKLGRKRDANDIWTADALETQSYGYNIRGWLLGVNHAEMLAANGSNSRHFAFELGYDKLTNAASRNFTNAQYNGNVSGMIWETSGDGIRRKYDYSYDNANRLMSGLFEQHDPGGNWGITQADFTMKMGNDGVDVASAYDANGNIQKMQHWGLKVTGPAPIDNLSYTYLPHSNKLQNVIDANNDTQTKQGDFRSSSLYMTALGTKTVAANDYTYDVNGNLKKDRNKDIGDGSNDGIVYNHLNLPQTITVRTTGGAVKGTITYTYDAAGSKLKKEVAETGQPVKTTHYLSGFIYENEALQFVGHEEGRTRYVPAVGATPARFYNDYFLKDHLGNVRMVLTDERQQDIYPAATLEGNLNTSTDAAYVEKNYYTIDAAKVVNNSEATGLPVYQNNNGNPPPNNNPNSNTTANSQKLYKLSATAAPNGGVTGLGFAIKVMGGDKIDIWGKSYYFQNNSSTNNYDVPVLNILDGFMGSPGSPGVGKTTGSEMNGVSLITSAIGTFLGNPNRNNDGTSTTPKAYINYILLDDNFRFVSGNFSRVNSSAGIKDHYNDAAMQNINVERSGYIYVYVSNQSPVNVFFDNLQVVHTRGPVLEETHYYPFGLTMAGISGKAVKQNYGENKRKYNGIEYENTFDLNIGETFYRTHDAQLGRWWQIDPKPIERFSSYAAVNNNPILLSDPLGDTTWVYNQNGRLLGVVPDKMKNQVHFIKTEGDPGQQFNTKGMSEKQVKHMAKGVRGTSYAFIGNKTAADMRSIVNKSTSLKLEIGFVGIIGKDKEIRLKALPTFGNTKKSTNLEEQIGVEYRTAEQQSNLALAGHTHISAFLDGFKFRDNSDMANLQGAGDPTDPEDYGNVMLRSKDATGKGRSPALIGTHWGIVVYGTDQNTIKATNNSYILYKGLKE